MVDLNISIFDYACKVAGARIKQKQNYNSSKPFSSNYELVGVLGEIVYGYWHNELFDSRLTTHGDKGFDFSKRVQVKSSEKYKARHLIEYMDKDFSKFDYYVLVTVDIQRMEGEVYGWISVEEFKEKAEVVDFGYGERLAVPLNVLHEIKN